MAATQILAPGTSAATSSDVVVAAGASVNLGLYSAAAATLPADAMFNIFIKTPGANTFIGRLVATQVAQVAGPGTFVVVREAYTGTGFGVFKEA